MLLALALPGQILAQAAPACPDLSAFTPVLDRAAGLLAAIIGAGLLLNALRGAATYAHAHGDPSKISHAKAIWKETGIGLAVVWPVEWLRLRSGGTTLPKVPDTSMSPARPTGTGPGCPGPCTGVASAARARAGPGDRGRVEGRRRFTVSRMLTISVPGVSAWRSALGVLSELSAGKVHLAFDADSATNPHVRRAGEETARALVAQGYDVVLETWDPTQAKGIDDALVAGVPITVTNWRPPKSAPSQDHLEDDRDQHSVEHPYRSTAAGMVWVKLTASGPVPVPLTDFRATIVSDVLDDDGAEISRRFEVEARLNGYCRRFSVGAEAFAAMSWATEQLGARAIIYPGIGLKDHARAAVQLLSGDVPERHVFTHSGWRQEAGEWVYPRRRCPGGTGDRRRFRGGPSCCPDGTVVARSAGRRGPDRRHPGQSATGRSGPASRELPVARCHLPCRPG